jgi:hypothetical protein
MNLKFFSLFVISASITLLNGCSDTAAPVESSAAIDPAAAALDPTAATINPTAAAHSNCDSDAGLEVYCGFKNAEDLALTPDGDFLVMTGFSALPDTYVSEMYLFDLETKTQAELTITLGENSWGDRACERESLDFSPHGLSLIERPDRAHQLAITNHLPSETIEMFELVNTDASWGLVWRGCVSAPDNTLLNDLTLTSNGQFYATQMHPADMPFEDLLAAGTSKTDTGQVWHWRGEAGYQPLAGTEGSFPNGIALSKDEAYLYINYWFSGKTTKFNLSTSTVEFEHASGLADNLTNINGDIWVAAHDMTIDQLSECPPTLAQCLLPFTIYNLSGDDLSEQAAYSYNSKVFGAATVAIPHEDKIWLGTFHGDRIASFER